MGFQDAVFLPSPATFKPHFVKIVAEFKTSWLPHALRLRLGVSNGALPVKYFSSN